VLPLAVLVWLTIARRLWRAWPMLLVATTSSGVFSALLWYALGAAADSLWVPNVTTCVIS
jgi:hypothetical protein